MTDLNWSMIGNGLTFQSLVSVIVRHEDVNARVYDRPGKDAAIDIKSGDGICVYQAKYIGDQKFNIAINESLNELKKIKKYRREGHPNNEFWADVKKWCLITNAEWNPGDEKKWKKRVVKKFEKEGFEEVIVWHHSDLVQKLIQFPHVKQEYFGGENRVFISLSEAFEKLENDQIVSFAMSHEFLGRKDKMQILIDFLNSSDKRVLPIHGPGGIGKSRFSLEASIIANNELAFDVYWTNVETMAASTSWFQTFIPSRKTLLVIDEPNEPDSLKVLLEQISLAKMANCKVLVITRTPKDPVLQVLRNPRSQTLENEIELKALSGKDIEGLSYNLLSGCDNLQNAMPHDLSVWSKRIVRISNGFPMWATLAVYLINEGKSVNELPEDEYGLASLYVEEILKHVPERLNDNKLAFKEFLELLSLFQPIYYETDQELLDFFAEWINIKKKSYLNELFDNLIKRNVCIKRGRLVEIKPDVIRDHIIYEWLGKNKSNAEKLVIEILRSNKFPHLKNVLRQLGRLELSYKIKGEEFSILEPIISELKKFAREGTLSNQYSVLDVASEFCFSRPLDLVEISQILRHNVRANEMIKLQFWGEHELSHTDLVLKLPWEIFDVGRYSLSDEEQENVFTELMELARYEYRHNKHEINDGKRATKLLQRLLPGGQEQFKAFDKIAYKWIEQKLDHLNEIEEDELNVLVELTKTMLLIEREDFFSEEWVVHLQTYLVHPNSEANIMRTTLRLKLWSIVEAENRKSDIRKIIWNLLAESHRQANVAADPWDRKPERPPDVIKYWEDELKDDLKRTLKILKEKRISPSDINEMRNIWSWNHLYDNREVLKSLATECEEAMNSNKEVSTLNQLFDHELYQKKNEISNEIARSLDSKEKILEFFSRAYNFTGDLTQYWYGVSEVAHNLGRYNFDKNYVKQYVIGVFGNESINNSQLYAACEIVAAKIKVVREKTPKNLSELFFNYYSSICNEESRHIFLDLMYHYPHPGTRGLLIDEDLDIISKIIQRKDYPITAITTLYFVSGYMFSIDFVKVKRLVDSLWEKTESADTANSYIALVKGIWYRTKFSNDFPFEFPHDFFKWLVGLLKQVPDLDKIEKVFEYELKEIQKKTEEELDVCWFNSFLKERVEKIEKGILKNGKFFSFHTRIFNHIKPILSAEEVTDAKTASFKGLLEFYNHESMLKYHLPEILTNFDPTGIILPDLVVVKLKDCDFQQQADPTENEGFKLIRYAAYYPINSAPWRTIAIETCKLIHELDSDKRKKIYSALLNKHYSTLTGRGNALSTHCLNAVKEAKKNLEDESEEILKDIMRYRLQIAESELGNEQQRVEEMEF
jgi:hypothetical protein